MGVSQGGAISPLLFNMYMADMPKIEGVMRTEYADDIALIVRKKNRGMHRKNAKSNE